MNSSLYTSRKLKKSLCDALKNQQILYLPKQIWVSYSLFHCEQCNRKAEAYQIMLPEAQLKEHNLIGPFKVLQNKRAFTLFSILPIEKSSSNSSLKKGAIVLAKANAKANARRLHNAFANRNALCATKQKFFTKKYNFNCKQIIRPLMFDCSRSLITAICKYANMPVYPDKSNLSIQYSRNRIRKQILPVLKLFLNPQTENALFQFAHFVFKEQKMLERLLSRKSLELLKNNISD